MAAYPGVKPHHFKGLDRDPDQPLKPSKALWSVLKQGRYFLNSKRKTQWTTYISQHLNPARNTSASFGCFCEGLAVLR
jgi:hypothetical protein